MNSAEIIQKLSSQSWADRMDAQTLLIELKDSTSWIKIFKALEDANYFTKKLAIQHSVNFCLNASFVEVDQLLNNIFFNSNQKLTNYADQEDIVKIIIETMLSSRRATYNAKVELLTTLFEKAISEINSVEKINFFIVLTKSLGILRAKRAIGLFENINNTSNYLLTLECIRSLRQIKDKKSMKTLEVLFNHSDSRVVNAAVLAYGEIGLGLYSIYRLVKIFPKSDVNIRTSIVSVISKMKDFVAFLVMKYLFNNETDEFVQIHILRKMSNIYSKSAAKFLIDIATSTKSNKIRIMAKWSFEALPSEVCLDVVKRNLYHKNHVRQWFALKKCSQFSKSDIDHVLDKWFRANKSSQPVLVHTLIESKFLVNSINDLDSNTIQNWLFEILKTSNKYDLLILSLVLSLKELNHERLIKLILTKPINSQKALLSYLYNTTHLTSLRVYINFLKELRGKREFWSDLECRYLYFKAALKIYSNQLNTNTLELFWNEIIKSYELIPSQVLQLLADFLSQNSIKTSIVFHQISIIQEVTNEISVLVENALNKVFYDRWSMQKWKDLILYAFSSTDNNKNNSLKNIVESFILKTNNYFEGIVNKLILEENDEHVLVVLGQIIAKKPSILNQKSIDKILYQMNSNQLECPVEVLKILISATEDKYLSFILDYTLLVKDSILKKSLYQVLASAKIQDRGLHV